MATKEERIIKALQVLDAIENAAHDPAAIASVTTGLIVANNPAFAPAAPLVERNIARALGGGKTLLGRLFGVLGFWK